jgi:hypothetical protein
MAQFRRSRLARPACSSRRSVATARRSFWVWLLPVFLLLGQYGEYRHELTHYAKKATDPEKAPTRADPCALCLAYGHLPGLAKPETFAALLLAGLRFHRHAAAGFSSASRALPAARNRGPPTA